MDSDSGRCGTSFACLAAGGGAFFSMKALMCSADMLAAASPAAQGQPARVATAFLFVFSPRRELSRTDRPKPRSHTSWIGSTHASEWEPCLSVETAPTRARGQQHTMASSARAGGCTTPRCCRGTRGRVRLEGEDDAAAVSGHACAPQRCRVATRRSCRSHTNAGNLQFARNWWHHLRAAGVDNFALLATDDAAYAALQHELPSRSVRLPHSIFAARDAGSNHNQYRSKGWTKLMFAVPLMVKFVLGAGLDVLWMDTDVVALSNPFPLIHAQLHELSRQGGGTVGSGSTLIASVDGRVPEEDLTECGRAYSASARWGSSAGGWKLCGGLFYLQHGRASAAFLDEWERRLHGPGAGAKNQPHYNEALRTKASGLTLRLLPCDLFPNGFRYASEPWRRAQSRAPVLVHNNWIKGHDAKVARFQRWGMWRAEANGTHAGIRDAPG